MFLAKALVEGSFLLTLSLGLALLQTVRLAEEVFNRLLVSVSLILVLILSVSRDTSHLKA